jgi:menaquinone-dependent protoporphyrinogen oxidase
MKPVGVFYATREGHTHRIAEHVATGLHEHGLDAEVHDVLALPRDMQLDEYAAAVLAASVHAGHHEREMILFVRDHLAWLERIPSAFLSVTLSEAGAERPDATPEEHARFVADVQKSLDQCNAETCRHPKHVKPDAGALLYTQYNFLVRLVMKRIARASGGSTDTSRVHDLTDLIVVDRFVEELAAEIGHND